MRVEKYSTLSTISGHGRDLISGGHYYFQPQVSSNEIIYVKNTL